MGIITAKKLFMKISFFILSIRVEYISDFWKTFFMNFELRVLRPVIDKLSKLHKNESSINVEFVDLCFTSVYECQVMF